MSAAPAPRAAAVSRIASGLLAAARTLAAAVEPLRFAAPVAYVYQPLRYAWEAHRSYCLRWGTTPRRVLLMGMNPGPYGMMQTGVPFGEVSWVRDWLGVRGRIRAPAHQHPRRPVLGWDCPRSEVSGARLWAGFAHRFGSPERFFAQHFVSNYCPLAFLDAAGHNLTPDRLPATERAELEAACDRQVRRQVQLLGCDWVVGIGRYSQARAAVALAGLPVRLAYLLHPSPASPAASRDWFGQAQRSLIAQGVWLE